MSRPTLNLTGSESDDYAELRLLKEKEEEVLAAVYFVCGAFEILMKEVRNRLKNVIGDRSVLVVDSAFELPSINMAYRLSKLRHDGFRDIADYFEYKVFGGKVPETVTGFLQVFFGKEINLVHHDVRDGSCEIGEYAAVVIGGSPACVSNSGQDVRLGDEDLSNSDVYNILSEFHAKAVELGTPVLGICYGSHVLTKLHGGEVGKLDVGRQKMDEIDTEEGRHILSALLGTDIDEKGEAYVAHSDASIAFGPTSMPVANAKNSDINIVQAALHVDPISGHFTGDERSDLALLKKVMSEGKYAGLGLQAHFELTFPNLLMSSIFNGLPLEDCSSLIERMRFTRQILGVIAGFFEQHKNFAPVA